jgi:hypothetical protein
MGKFGRPMQAVHSAGCLRPMTRQRKSEMCALHIKWCIAKTAFYQKNSMIKAVAAATFHARNRVDAAGNFLRVRSSFGLRGPLGDAEPAV